MRLFTAIELPADVRESLASVQAQLKQRIAGRVSWVEPANLHVTLKFLGEVADAEVVRVCEALKAISAPKFSIAISKLGTLPPRGAARVLIAEMAGETDRLAELFEAIEKACEPLGFACEQRRFHPHITLARLRLPRRVSREMAAVKLERPPAFEVREFVLMQSHLSSRGSEYQKVMTVSAR